ncbi:hypothetical protein VTL71DRAFT_3620 [Oculimacula yallundae]|uniref:Zn(2)-C6 fungal-type domain-containing protein n=1 Tax=Oculimacula yallundae TaxID=86028 RepID=A0ABR4C883_9HELO
MESDALVLKSKKGRKSNGKSKSGCVTCKARHVKCDETKPHCKRCTSTGRTCDGYQSQKPPKPTQSALVRIAPASSTATAIPFHKGYMRQHSTLSLPPSSNPGIPSSDLRALNFYHCRTSTIMGGWHLAPFWTYQLPQIAHSQLSIRHAMIAMSSIHENLEQARDGGCNDPVLDHSRASCRINFAETHYLSAVSTLAKDLANGEASEEVALSSCAMFVVYNVIAGGNFIGGMWHLQHGLEILGRWKKQRGKALIEGSLEANLVDLMKKLSFDSEAMEDSAPLNAKPEADIYTFTDIAAAEKTVLALAKEGLRLIRMNVLVSREADLNRQQLLQMEVSNHIANLASWQTRLERIVSDPLFIHTSEDKDSIRQLWILQLSARIWIYAGFPPAGEPEPTKMFATFVSLVAEQLESWRSKDMEKYASVFFFEKGLLPSLNYILAHSSDSDVREMAMAVYAKSAPAS